jgi:ElaB/YqjD/DUF883 family membrane-anchored ribosome-binding protein
LQGFQDRLNRKLEGMDSALLSIRADSRASLEGLEDVASIVRRLERKLDRIMEAESDLADRNIHSMKSQAMNDIGNVEPVAAQTKRGSSVGKETMQDKDKDVTSEGAQYACSEHGNAHCVLGLATTLSHVESGEHNLLLGLDKKIERIAGAVGVLFTGGGHGDDNEDRKRLKEKLKAALERQTRTIVAEQEEWMEYIFGICKPDGRVGKRGSRYNSCDETFYAMFL